MPSFFNGIFGHKPSPDVVPNSGQFPDATGNRQQFLCTGPMCRYAEDLKPLLKVCTHEYIRNVALPFHHIGSWKILKFCCVIFQNWI